MDTIPASPEIQPILQTDPEPQSAPEFALQPTPQPSLEPAAALIFQPAPQPLPSVAESPLAYDRERAQRIARHVCELLHPAYVLLFGSLAGGTPHSDTSTFDLLVVVDGEPAYDWFAVKRYLKMKMPRLGHGAPYLNIYLHKLHAIETSTSPFLYFACTEGILLYRECGRAFRRPSKEFDFGLAVARAKRYRATFLPLADRLLTQAGEMSDPTAVRMSAFAMVQAAVYCLRTLFFVYHGFEPETSDPEILHHRLRTLSGELPLLFEPDSYHPVCTLGCLKRFMDDGRYDPDFSIHPEELRQHLERVNRLRELTGRLCRQRITLYQARVG